MKNKKLLIIGIIALLAVSGIFIFQDNFKGENIDYTFQDDVNVESQINSYLRDGNLIIDYTNPNGEIVWIEGLPQDRYSINDKKITIYNYQSWELFKLHIGEESDVYEFGEDFSSLDTYKDYDVKIKEITIFEEKTLAEDVELAKVKLTKNTEFCYNYCEAEGITFLNFKTPLFDRMDFYGEDNKEVNVEYTIYVKGEINQTAIRVKDISYTKNGTEIFTYEEYNKTIDAWIPYNFEVMEAGLYEWRIEGYREDVTKSVDWIGTTMGLELDEWAWWEGQDVTITNFTSNDTFTVPAGVTNVSVIVIAGGGGAGSQDRNGGGGAGGVIQDYNYAVTPEEEISIIVGVGGPGYTDILIAPRGQNSSFGTLQANGGGGGTTLTGGTVGSEGYKRNGGSGGGGGSLTDGNTAGIAIPSSQGNDGGVGSPPGEYRAGGGGGGFGSVGLKATTTNVGGVGGGGIIFNGLEYASGGYGAGTSNTWQTGNATDNTGRGANGTYYNGANWGGSGIVIVIYSNVIPDTTPPTYSDNQTNNTIVGLSTVFAIKYDDDTVLETLGGYIFSTNNSGSWVNESLVMWTSTPEWANVTKILNDTVSVIVGYRWYANDSAGNVNNTELFSVITTDITPPLITITYPTATTYSENVSNLNYTYIELYPDSCWYSTNGGTINSSLVNVGTNFTDVISVGGSNTWFLYCNDTSDNLNVSSITFDVNVLWYNTGYPFTNKSFRITEFINVSGTNFTLGGEPYKLIGANFYYAIDYMTNHTYTDNGEELNGSEEDVYEVLNEMQYLGINVVRTWGTMMGGNSGETNATWEVDTIGGHYNLGEVYYPGNYNETFFKAFDKFLYEASKRDIRTQIVLINNWEAYGGMQWYLSHSTTSDKTYEDALYLSDNWWTWHDQFYTDADANIYFQNTINYILNRNNTYTGILYKDDPTIFSWMIANEPRAKTGNHSVIANWCNDTATYIKSIDSNHLVTCGIESLGFNETWGEGANMITTYNNTASDYITFAMNTGQWGYMVGLAETSNDGVYMCAPDGSNCGIGNANVRAFWAYGHNYTYNSYWHSNLPWWIPELARHGYDNWVTQNVKWANEIGKPVMLQELVVDQSYSDATKDNVYLNAISNFYSNGGDGIMLWTMNSDSYYRNSDTSSTGNQDDGYGFYLSDNSTLKTLSASSINAIQNATDYTTSLNSYKYNFVLNIGFASDTIIDNCTLFLNVSNGTDWTDYYADQSNTSAIIYDDDYTFTTQFDSDDEEFYWYTECYGDSTIITSDVNHVQVKSATPIINLVSPGNNTSYNTDALDFFYNVTNTIDISFCELYIDEELNKTDYSVSLDINQSFSVSDFSDATYNWSVKCTDTDSNEGFSETRTFIIDATPPYFITIPSNTSIFYLNETLSVTYVGTDETGFGYYYINDTTNFAINQTGFLINNTPLSAGNYFVNVTINDTLNNINWAIFTLEVNQSLYSCDIILNDTSPLTFHETLLIHTNCSSAYTMKLNGTTISNDSVLDSGVGGFNISVERTDATNYSNIYDEEIVSVLQNADNCQVAFNETSPITFPETFTSFTDCSSAYTLYLNGSAVVNNSVVNYGANYFNFSVQRTDIQNYSNIYDDEYFTVSQSSDTCEVAFNETSPISFPGQFQAFSSCESVSTLTLNGTTISNDSAVISGAGYWNISVLRTDATNYTNYFDDEWFNVSKAILSGSLTNNETWTETYPTSVTIGLSESNAQDGDVEYYVWRDNVNKSSGESVLLSATTYAYILNTSGGLNYSSASLDTETLTINKNSDDCEVFFNTTSPIVYLETFIVWHSCDSTSVLTQNGTSISNNSVVNYGVGGYNYSVLRTDATNYSNYFDDETFSVLKNGNALNVLFNETSPIIFPKTFKAYSDSSTAGTLKLNGTTIANNSIVNGGATYWNVSFQRTDTTNYTNTFDDEFFTISKNGGDCQVLFNETSPHINNTAFVSYTNCTTGFQMYRNGSIIGNNSQQYPLNANTYNYSVFRNDTINYSNYFDDEWFIVSIPPPSIPPVPSPYDDLTKSIAQILQALIVLAAAIIIMFLVRSLYRDERTFAEVIKVGLLVGLFTFILILLMPIMVSYIADLIN